MGRTFTLCIIECIHLNGLSWIEREAYLVEAPALENALNNESRCVVGEKVVVDGSRIGFAFLKVVQKEALQEDHLETR